MIVRKPGVLIIADIEGSSGCWSYEASQYKTREWARACRDMSQDIDAVVKGLFEAGAEDITVKDFHRTGYNLLPELIDGRATIIHGYRRGPVPGIGDPRGASLLYMIGMHAASGSDGFLAHTLTSRIARLEVNGRLMSEAELFSSSVARYGLRPVFLSGCPVACRQAEDAIRGIQTCSIKKTGLQESFDSDAWRKRISSAAAEALGNISTEPYCPPGPFSATVIMRDGPADARKIAGTWGLDVRDDAINVHAVDMESLYRSLIRICYLTPAIEKFLPFGLSLYNIMGRAGMRWVRGTAAKY
ncbi:MAG: M55 family metallopeptidase [Spirochaetes bacterium]|nr:M55 family metallopeptidase [Spirochaetota bacterium]